MELDYIAVSTNFFLHHGDPDPYSKFWFGFLCPKHFCSPRPHNHIRICWFPVFVQDEGM